MNTDTIYALATAPGKAGVSVIRVSGSLTSSIASKIIRTVLSPRYAHYVTFRDTLGSPIDRGLAILFPSPGSYTGEDMLEMHTHGSRAVQQSIFAVLSSCGARLAMAGEFTRRALQNGKMDAIQAEGLQALLDSETEAQREQALLHMDGCFTADLNEIFTDLKNCLAITEAHLDFPEEGFENNASIELETKIVRIRQRIDAYLSNFNRSRLLSKGLRVALLGAPNVGKSSLLNYLAQRDIAIVSERAGTTRDVIETRVELAGVAVTFFDTAGLRETTDAIEAEGIRRTHLAIAEADLVIALFDNNWVDQQSIVMSSLRDKPCIQVINKVDLINVVDSAVPEGASLISLRSNIGITSFLDRLTSTILSLVGDVSLPMPITDRQYSLLHQLYDKLFSICSYDNLELLAEDLRYSLQILAQLYGRVDNEEVLDILFAKFCIGK